MAFTTVDNVTLFLNNPTLSRPHELLIPMLISMIDGSIKNYCGWEIAAKDYVTKFDGNGTNTLDLRVYPLNTLASLTIDGEYYTEIVSLNEADGELYFDSNAGSVFTAGKQNVVASYNAGFTAIPTDLEYVATYLVVLNFNRITQEAIGVSEDTFNNVKVKYDPSDIPKLVSNALDMYRRRSVY